MESSVEESTLSSTGNVRRESSDEALISSLGLSLDLTTRTYLSVRPHRLSEPLI